MRLGSAVSDLRKPLTACTRPGRSHFQKTDVLLGRAGHLFPERILENCVLNPWEALASKPFADGMDGFNSSVVHQLLSWTRALRSKTVLVVHPFTLTIAAQLARGNVALWGDLAEDIMPSGIRFKLARAPQNLGNLTEQETWRDAFEELVARVDAAGPFDIALISCGGLGLLLGAHLKATNRSSIYHGGALQLWFGIIGKRWSGSYMARTNRNWTKPLNPDIPKTFFRSNAKSGDGSAYW